MNGSRILFSKNLLTNSDISEYYKNLENPENTLRNSYKGNDPANETKIMDTMREMRLLVISELESGKPLSDAVKDDVIKTLENLLFIAKSRLSKGTFEGSIEGIQKYLEDIKKS